MPKHKPNHGLGTAKNESISRPNHPRIDLYEAIVLRYRKGLTFQQIADHFGVSKPAVFQRIRRFRKLLLDPDRLRALQEQQEALLAGAKLRLLQELTNPEKLDKATLRSLAYAFKQLDKVHRLQQAQSTANVNLNTLSESERKLLEKYVGDAIQEESCEQREEHGEVIEVLEEENQDEPG